MECMNFWTLDKVEAIARQWRHVFSSPIPLQ
jgi:hypothetical protein